MWTIDSENVSLERLDGETIVINFDSGEYFSFRGPSADILWLVSNEVEEEHWLAIFREAFSNVDDRAQEVQEQILTFLRALLEAGLIREDPGQGGAPVALPQDYERKEWNAPVVHANDDLVDLLVIDPIHDSSEDGWPEARA